MIKTKRNMSPAVIEDLEWRKKKKKHKNEKCTPMNGLKLHPKKRIYRQFYMRAVVVAFWYFSRTSFSTLFSEKEDLGLRILRERGTLSYFQKKRVNSKFKMLK